MTGISKKFKGLPVKPGTKKKDAAKMFHDVFVMFIKSQKGRTFKATGSAKNNPFRVKTIPAGIVIMPESRTQPQILKDQQLLFNVFRKFVKKGSIVPEDLEPLGNSEYLLPLMRAFLKSKVFKTVFLNPPETSYDDIISRVMKNKPKKRLVKSIFKDSMHGFGFITAPDIDYKPLSKLFKSDDLEIKTTKTTTEKGWGTTRGWEELEKIMPTRGPDLTHEAIIDKKEVKDPPRSSYALLESDENVIMNETFTVRVGLSKLPGKNNKPGKQLERPEFSRGPYDMDIELLAPGFSMVDGNWKFTMRVTAEKPYPVEEIRLKAKPLTKDLPFEARLIRAIYSTEGHTMGSLVIAVAVLRQEGLDGPLSDEKPPPQTVVIPPKQEVADLTIRITRGDRDRDLVWSFDSPHSPLMKLIERKAPVMDIGTNSREFAKSVIEKVELNAAKPRKLYRYLLGAGKRVFRKTPAVFRRLLSELKKLSLDDPTLLVQSEDPYIPWELMVLPEDHLFIADASPFLSAQLRVGRWLFGSLGKNPPVKLLGSDMLVIAGTYDSPTFENLKFALEEAGELKKEYHAGEVIARDQDIMDCLDNRPPGDILHFAVHGKYAPGSVDEGIVTIDEQYLDSTTIEGFDPLPRKPFVFLNACQVGSSSEMLGDYAGIAAAFLYIGASGVIAPLWSVNDEKAKEIALGFYQGAFKGVSPAEILRSRRAGFSQSNADSTSVAYIYFGHPAMNMTRPRL